MAFLKKKFSEIPLLDSPGLFFLSPGGENWPQKKTPLLLFPSFHLWDGFLLFHKVWQGFITSSNKTKRTH
jgi:hypothetical protein